MQELDDSSLLREYVERGSEEAFGTLVTRHVNKVYSVALRHTGNAHQAEEITQAVFVILAKKSRNLGKNVILSGWLYHTARLTALTFIRGEIRRAQREQEAYMQTGLNENESEAWPQIAPLLDSAMSGLNEADRHAVVLRFFDGKSMREVGATLGASEDAAKMRVNRALEKLRKFFAKRGVVATTAIIAGAISTNSVQAAPAALANAATVIALAKGATASASTLTLIQGALKIMAWTKVKVTLVIAAGVLLTVGTVTTGVKIMHSHRQQPNIQGAWEGVIEVAGKGQLSALVTKIRVVLHVNGTNNAYHATIDGIDTRVKDIPITDFAYDYPSLRFDRPPNPRDSSTGSFEGKFNTTVDEISGTWKTAGTDLPLVFKRTTTPDPVPELLAESDYAPRRGSDLQGYWRGALKAGTVELRLAFKISEPSDGQYVAEMVSMDQGGADTVVSSVTYDRPTVRLEVGSGGGVFEGKLSPNGTRITGTWTQARVPLPLTIERTDPKADQSAAAVQDADKDYSPAGPNDLTGHWKGALDIKGQKLHLALHIGKLSDGTLSGTLDSIDQHANGIAANVVRFTAPNAHLEWKTLGATYDGKLQGGKISGTFRQAGQTFPLAFARTTED